MLNDYSWLQLILAVLVATLVFLLFRELWCWYTKQTEIVKNQNEIIRLLKKIAGEEEVKEDKEEKVKKTSEKEEEK